MSGTKKNHFARNAGIAAVLLAILIGFYLWKNHQNKKTTYKSYRLERGRIDLTINATGTVKPQNRLEIKPPIAGRIEEVKVVEGQKVKKGDVLAMMSSSERAAMLDAAQSQGPKELKRWEGLYRPTPVLSPIDGTIITRGVEAGQTFTNTEFIMVMSDRLIVKAQVDETDMAQVKLSQKAHIQLDAYPEEKIEAKVDHIAFEAVTVNNVTTYLVDVLPLSIPESMRSGMTANITFFVDSREDALLVPTEAVKMEGGKNFVTQKDPRSGVVSDREIQLGISDGKSTEVLGDDFKANDEVLVVEVSLPDGEKKSGNPFAPSRPRGQGRGQGKK